MNHDHDYSYMYMPVHSCMGTYIGAIMYNHNTRYLH
jgi:hypothetical protein